ncbi:type III secretion system outer membrane ring subunit SctC [Xanthomonas theicola]|uniref:type III secretion system outer membrane ring subunit SctC n=1 Tax=Xanthomonas theicola TaxID=56464 RepID=UPI0013048DB6|nr:type III secretion system outer membrane ring subunit SctC [Xanthomonas theicola]QNH25252.1 EscC/YscC/HrcC family type III secretion system outer membrane ring protein [Xanthomonas theicola]
MAATFLFACQMALASGIDISKQNSSGQAAGYVARQENMRAFFGGVSAYLGKPIIVSKLAAGKQISGEFDFSAGDVVGKVSRQMGLITYYDGNAIYVYDASETKNSVIKLINVSSATLNAFLKKSGLIDPRYPLRGDGIDTFYLAGPPIYVDLVKKAAEFMDSQDVGMEDQHVEVIRLNNTFVTDRSYTRRDENIVIPGIATVVENLLEGDVDRTAADVKKSIGASLLPDKKIERKGVPPASFFDTPSDRPAIPAPDAPVAALETANAPANPRPDGKIRIIAYPETNSLLVKGTVEQIRLIRNLVKALDEEKRHVELALWIIDLQKDDLDQLGVDWQGSISSGKHFSAGFNSGNYLNSFSALEGDRFMASILALARQDKAQIVSRPVVLTQENTPAMFDNSRTFYTQLIAERAVDLQSVTYGTLVSVLPRFTAKGEIELSLNIEDGSEVQRNETDDQSVLPTIGRTKISTVARVPKGKSLLVGGYTRGENDEHIGKIPLLGDLPLIGGAFRYRRTLNKNTVRIFLIHPREITEGFDINTENIDEAVKFETLIRQMDKTRETVQ